MSALETVKATLAHAAAAQSEMTAGIVATTPLLPPPAKLNSNAAASASTSQPSTPLRAKNQQQIISLASAAGVAAGSVDKDRLETAGTAGKGKMQPKPPEEFWKDLQQFHDRRGTPMTHAPKISGQLVDLFKLYNEVTERGGFNKVNMRDEWDEVYSAMESLREKCVNGTAAIKHLYRRYLDKYERLNFFGEDPDKMEALEAAIENGDIGGGRSRSRYSQHGSLLSSIFGNNISALTAVPMSYNHRQHIVNMDRRRQFKLSMDLHKNTPLEKLLLSLLSPLPNEQDFAINVCTLMTNEAKSALKLTECAKIVDVLLAHMGVYADYTMRKLFQHVYTNIRRHSQYGFWRDLLQDKPQILDLYTDEQAWLDNGLVKRDKPKEDPIRAALLEDCHTLDFLNLRRGNGTHDYMGQRVLQIMQIFRSLSFFDENLSVLAKNRTFWRFIVMAGNIRWGNIHIQALETAGNVATEFELHDPTTDELSRNLMAMLCEGIDSMDRGVIINSLEILYKLCNKEGNDQHVYSCLNVDFYRRLSLLLTLNDVMMLIFTLEAIYAISSLGSRSCANFMQVRGFVDQLVSLITVEAQTYGPDGCILMRVVEIVPGNMLPMVAQNIANLQNAAVNKHQAAPLVMPQQPILAPPAPHEILQQQQTLLEQQPMPMLPQPSLPQVHLPPPQHVVATPAAAQSFTQDDEQYALAWLGATFERATTNESHIEQQELYRMYLGHCQKSGKHSVVNHVQFPRLVRLIFNSTVGPVVVRRIDGNELPGLHYVSIRLRAQPLPIQNKNAPAVSAISPKVESARKKKKMKQEAAQNTTVESTAEPVSNPTPPAINTTSVEPKTEAQLMITATATTTQATLQPEQKSVPAASADELSASSSNLQPQQTSTSSLIKSLLANKVNQRQQKQKELVAAPTVVATTSTSIGSQQQPAMPITTVAQLQQQQQQTLPIKVTSTAISALVNNPMMHHTPVKVGQTTIKPLNPQMTLEKKTLISDSAPPPLAPLSGSNVVTKDASGRTVIIANQSLVDLPNTIIKRKMTIDDNMENIKRVALDNSTVSNAKEDTVVTPSKNAANLYAEMAASILEDEDLDDIPPLLATQQQQEIAQAPHQQQQQQQQQQLVKMQLPQNASVQRQIVFQTNAQGQPTGAPQLKLTAGNAAQQIPTAMATIKTDQGLQTVPVILQPKSLDQGQSTQILQQVIQHAQQTGPQPVQQQTQYVLATNQQGQTYLVAQQQPPPPPPPTQTVLVTQTPQQQTTGTKTIIILQQQALPNQNASTQQQQIITTGPGLGGGQKMIMTTAQGQQVLVTQRPTTPQQQIIINPQTGAATHIQHGHGIPVSTGGGSNASTLMQRPQGSSATGQISPSLLSQLNQIPATIKLHQPQPPPVPQPPQQATISRIGGKTVQLVQTPTPVVPPPPPALQIPQLQQHQSIIQQHIISGPNEKRQMLLSGGRAIEIKETLITQTPPVQQSQLNSQTIITTQQAPAQQVSAVLQQQQQQQHIRAVIEQQQHPSIIQQKITMPHVQQQQQQQAQLMVTQQQQQQQFSTPGGQTSTELPTLVQTTPQIVNKSHLKQTLVTTKKPLEPKAATVAAATTTTTTADAAAKPTARIEEKPTTTIPATAAHITTTTTTPTTPATTTTQSTPAAVVPVAAPPAPPPTTTTVNAIPSDVNWLFICDWRNCPRRKFKSLGELQHHVCTVHCPDHLDTAAEIFCQWGTGPGFCDNVPRKRFSLMTHLIDRHLSLDSLRASVQRRIATGIYNVSPAQPAVTIVRNMENLQRGNTASPAPSSGSSSSSTNATPGTAPAAATNLAGSSALQAIKRHTADFVNPKELMDENEGPVTKSIRLTAALILRNLVMYTTTAKRQLRYHEPHLANVALSNVESSSTLSQILYELNN